MGLLDPDVTVISRSFHDNEISLDFADTEEIPSFLRNWNAKKKRKFKPRLNNCRPVKRQRRTEPDFAA